MFVKFTGKTPKLILINLRHWWPMYELINASGCYCLNKKSVLRKCTVEWLRLHVANLRCNLVDPKWQPSARVCLVACYLTCFPSRRPRSALQLTVDTRKCLRRVQLKHRLPNLHGVPFRSKNCVNFTID